MLLNFLCLLWLGGFKAVLWGWTVFRRLASKAGDPSRSDSPWRPCPGVYALLVDIHRNH